MTWYAVGVAAVGAVTSIAGGISGKADAEKAGKMQAKVIEATEEENQRRKQLDLDQKMGLIKGNVAASNLIMGGSSKRYANAFESNYRSEMAWDKQKARMSARVAKKTGQLTGQSALYSGTGSAIGFAAQAISYVPASE